MFTGIIEEIGFLQRVEKSEASRRLAIEAAFAGDLSVDQSVAVNGACLTVVEQNAESFTVDVIEETLQKTTLGSFKQGDQLNLERALILGDRLDGHLVQGHVDATGTIEIVEQLSKYRNACIVYPQEFAPFLIPVGSVTVDGISLTIAELDEPEGTFEVGLIPHTLEHTTASSWQPGEKVNLEFDVIGKYVQRRVSPRSVDL